MMRQIFSISERSGLQVGQFSSRTLLLWSHSVVIAVVCDFALSCWNIKFKFKILMLAYRTASGSAPSFLHSLMKIYIPSWSLRSASERHLVVPSQRGTKSRSRTFSFTGPGWWNELPTPIRNAESLTIFDWHFWTLFTYFALKSFSWHLQMAQWTVFTDSGFWMYSWAHLVMSVTESCRWLMQCRLRAQRQWASNKEWDVSSFSESFDAVMHCRWCCWSLESLVGS